LQQGQDATVVGVQLTVHINTFYGDYLELNDSKFRNIGSS